MVLTFINMLRVCRSRILFRFRLSYNFNVNLKQWRLQEFPDGGRGCQRQRLRRQPIQWRIYVVKFWTPPPGPDSFNFMQFLGKFGKIVCWSPPGELMPPPRGNPGSATAIRSISTKFLENCIKMKEIGLRICQCEVQGFVRFCNNITFNSNEDAHILEKNYLYIENVCNKTRNNFENFDPWSSMKYQHNERINDIWTQYESVHWSMEYQIISNDCLSNLTTWLIHVAFANQIKHCFEVRYFPWPFKIHLSFSYWARYIHLGEFA